MKIKYRLSHVKRPYIVIITIISIWSFLFCFALHVKDCSGVTQELRPLAAKESRISGKTTKMQSRKGRLLGTHPYIINCLNKHSTLVLDAGIGFPFDTVLELKGAIAETYPGVKVIAVDINLPAMVVQTSGALPGLGSAANLIFNKRGELIAVNAIPYSYTGKQLREKEDKNITYKTCMVLKERLTQQLHNAGGTFFTDDAGNKIIIDPASAPENQRPGLSYVSGDILDPSLLIPKGSVDVIRDMNTTELYYASPEEKHAMLEAEGRLLKEGGRIVMGLTSILRRTEEFTVYQKKGENGTPIPIAFVFSIDPDLASVEYPGTESSASPSYFKTDQQLYEAYMRVVISLIPDGMGEKGLTYFEDMQKTDPNYRTVFLQSIIDGLRQRGYDVSLDINGSVILNYQGEGLLKQGAPTPVILRDISQGARSGLEASILRPLPVLESTRPVPGKNGSPTVAGRALSKELSEWREEYRRQLGEEISAVSYVLRTIQRCFQGRPSSTMDLVTAAVKNNILTAGEVKEDVRKAIEWALQERPIVAKKLIIESLKSNILTQAEAEDDLRELVRVHLEKRWDLIGELIIDTTTDKIFSIDEKKEILKRVIEINLQINLPVVAMEFVIKGVKNNIFTPDAVKDGMMGLIKKHLNNQPELVGKIIIDSVTNKILSAADVKEDLKKALDLTRRNLPSAVKIFAIEGVKNGIFAPGEVREELRDLIAMHQIYDPDFARQVAIGAVGNNILSAEDIDDYVTRMINGNLKTNPDLAGDIAIDAVTNKILTVNEVKSDLMNSIQTCLSLPDNAFSAGELAIRAVKERVFAAGEVKDILIRAIRICLLANNGKLAIQLAGGGIKNGILTADEIKDDVKRTIRVPPQNWGPIVVGQFIMDAVEENVLTLDDEVREALRNSAEGCFRNHKDLAAGQFAIGLLRNMRFSRKAERIRGLLQDPAIAIKNGLDVSLSIVAYGLRHDQVDRIIPVLASLKQYGGHIGFVRLLFSIEGEDVVLAEIFGKQGIEHLARLCDNIYSSIFADVLPENVSMTDKRTNVVLRYITHFDTSKFARRDLKFEDIYRHYLQDYHEGKIRPLPTGIVGPRTVEAATKRRAVLSADAEKYYIELMELVKAAINAPSLLPYQNASTQLIALIDGRIALLERTISTGIDMKGRPLKPQAIEGMRAEIAMLVSTKEKLSTGKSVTTSPLILLDAPQFKAMNNVQGAVSLIRILLFIHAFQDNPSWRNHFVQHQEEEPSLELVIEMTEFINSFVKPHLLEEMDPKAQMELAKNVNVGLFKKEIDQLMPTGERPAFKRRITIYPTRGWLAEFIGYFSDECWTKTTNIMRDNPDVFALILVDEDTKELLGGTLIMPNFVSGRKGLIDRGFSPRAEVTNQLDMDDFMGKIIAYEEDIARSLKAQGIVVPLRQLEEGLGTNNPDVIQWYERTLKGERPVVLGIANTFNGHDITFGKCVVLRRIGAFDDISAVCKIAPRAEQNILRPLPLWERAFSLEKTRSKLYNTICIYAD